MAKAAAIAAISMAGLSLAACEDGAPEPNQTKVKVRNAYVEQLNQLSELNRGLGLRRAILDSPGGKCKKVDYSGFQEDFRNMSVWIVRCSDGNDWALFIAPSADVQVRNCRDMKSLDLPECKLPAIPAPDKSGG
jgi:hypothetical protein